MENQSFSAVLKKEEEMFIAECPEVGTVSQGNTIEEALSNLKEATELYLEEFPITENTKPIITVFEVSRNAVEENIRA
jgi:predicted RNase H-like HicB family nuclease